MAAAEAPGPALAHTLAARVLAVAELAVEPGRGGTGQEHELINHKPYLRRQAR